MISKPTFREMQIGAMTAQGLTEKEIGVELFLSTQTIHTHKKNLARKLGARNIADITRMVIDMLTPSEVNIHKIIAETVKEAKDQRKVFVVMIVALMLQGFSMFAELDEMRARRLRAKAKTGKVVRRAGTRAKKNEYQFQYTA